jgi:undecaprenyl-diphosphatase
VHWPTDVIAGWAAGAAWAVGVWLLARQLQRGRQIDQEGDEGT